MEFSYFKTFITFQVYFTIIIIAISIQASYGRDIAVQEQNAAVGLEFPIISGNRNGGGSLGQDLGQSYTYTDLSADLADSLFNVTTYWKQFKTEHVLNPDQNPGFQNWDKKEWRRWMRKMWNPTKALQNGNSTSTDINNRRRRHGNGNTFSNGQRFPSSMKHIEVVVIGTSTDVLAAFKGKLMKYGTSNQALVWSSRRFPTFIFQKSGKHIGIFECGEMYIAGRLLNGYPVYLHDFYPTQVKNPLGGNLRFPIKQRCNEISKK